MMSLNRYTTLSILLTTLACGEEPNAIDLGSRFLKSELVLATSGGGFEVSNSDSAEFMGVGIQIPPAALTEDTTITVVPTADLALPDDAEWVGPAMEFGPAGLEFATPATVTLRVDAALGDNDPVVRVVSADGSTEWIESGDIIVNADDTWSFPVDHFTRFQPGGRSTSRNPPMASCNCMPGSVCLSGSVCVEVLPPQSGATIREVAENAGVFNTLLQTIDGLDIAGLLARPGDLTAFAPTDAAFAALPVNLSQVDPVIVENIILSHIAGDVLDAAALTAEGQVTTISKVTQPFTGSAVRGASVALTDVQASNGIVHILDEVIVPPTTVEYTVERGGFDELASAISLASAATQAAVDPDTLNGASPVTIFAPTDAAFQETNLAGLNLNAVLGLHVVAGQVTSADLQPGTVLTTVTGGRLTVGNQGLRGTSLTDERGNVISVLTKDVRTLSGVVHTIDGVLLPTP